MDATGIGHGLSAMLRASLGEAAVLPFVFTAISKSDLGWRFLAAVETGRYRDYADDADVASLRVIECAYAAGGSPGVRTHGGQPSQAGAVPGR